VTHWRSKVTVSIMADDLSIDRKAVPYELYKYLKLHPEEGSYLPMVYIDRLSYRLRDLVVSDC